MAEKKREKLLIAVALIGAGYYVMNYTYTDKMIAYVLMGAGAALAAFDLMGSKEGGEAKKIPMLLIGGALIVGGFLLMQYTQVDPMIAYIVMGAGAVMVAFDLMGKKEE